jgi:hypothetical protein
LGTGPGGGPADPGSDAALDQELMRAALQRVVHDQLGPGELWVALGMVRDAGLDPREEYDRALGNLPGSETVLPAYEEVDPDGPKPGSTEPMGEEPSAATDLESPSVPSPLPPEAPGDLEAPEEPLPPEPEPQPVGPPDPRAALRRAVAQGNRGRPAPPPRRPAS